MKSGLDGGRMVYIGMGGAIDGVVNPRLEAKVGDIVTIKFMSGEGAEHNFVIPDLGVDSGHVVGQGKTVSVTFGVDRPGEFAYFCDLPGHRQAGMEGVLAVAGEAGVAQSTPASDQATTMPGMDMAAATSGSASPAVGASSPVSEATGADIVRDPTDLPAPLGGRGPQKVRLDLVASEVVGQG
ncbi:MAG TPA: cupredoxin domain-containing protein, partial [Anaerolineales bacterium]|nr:cupredoxin domain-containing protein [Anaerolineales bacterium]